jgi:AsmA family protein
LTEHTIPRRRVDWRTAPAEASTQLANAWRNASSRRRGGVVIGLLLIAAIVLLVVLFDWNWLRGPVSGLASGALHREVRIEGDLKVHPWSLAPRAEATNIRIGNPAWAGAQPMATVQRLAVQVKLLPLLKGDVILPLLEVDTPNVGLVRETDGRANWLFGDPNKKAGKPIKLPAIQHFIIDGGQLRYEDKQREITFVGTVTTNEQSTGSERGAFRLTGDGQLNHAPFTALVTGAPLLNISPNRPYPFEAHVHGGATSLDAVGQVNKPFDLGRFGGQVALAGPDLNDLYRLTGLALPNTPPYRIAGRLERTGAKWTLNGFTGRIGDSDINGDLAVETGGERPLLTADVRSRKLDFDDLGSLLGGAPSRARGESMSPEQAAIGATMAAHQKLLPDATLQVDRIRAMDAEVKYRAESVNAPGLPMNKVMLDLSLKAGVLTMHPLSFTFSRGALVSDIRLDATKDTPVTSLDARLTNARLEDWLTIKGSDGKPAVEGVIAARAKLVGSGNSVHRAASSSNGTITAVIPKGQIRQAFAELLGVNASKGLLLLLAKDNRETSLRCAVADFKVTDGVMRANRIVLDTGVVIASGAGTIDLKDEKLDLRIEGDSKKPRLVRLFIPIKINGPLTKPAFGLETGAVAVQGGVAAALGGLLSPIAALLPFVDPGLANDADCAALVGSAQTKGAPVTTKTTAAATPKRG